MLDRDIEPDYDPVPDIVASIIEDGFEYFLNDVMDIEVFLILHI